MIDGGAPKSTHGGPAGPAALQAFHPFLRLQRLLDATAPGRSPLPDGIPVMLQVGEPQNQPPAFVAQALSEAAAGWSRYPPPRGTAEYLDSAREWLSRRFSLPEGMIDPSRHLIAVPGTREGLFFAALSAVGRKAEREGEGGNGGRAAILLPNPFYHVYCGAALMSGAEPVFVPACREGGFQPDYTALPPEVLRRAALAFVCSPANPQGSVMPPEAMRALVRLAREHDFAVAFDECYCEIYGDTPPVGALQALAEAGDHSLDNVLVFHSLSKRSSAAGLRCGVVAGDPVLIDALDAAMRLGGAGVPTPVAAAGTRLWRDEAHVEANRARYRENFEVAARLLGNRFDARPPAGGFFLWLDVGDGEEAALRLWREAGIRSLPGAYMAREDAAGENPGEPYLRLALVYERPVIEAALGRIADIL